MQSFAADHSLSCLRTLRDIISYSRKECNSFFKNFYYFFDFVFSIDITVRIISLPLKAAMNKTKAI